MVDLKAFIKLFFLLSLVFCLTGCSRKKNSFVNRNWHAVTAEYNTLYNGNLALELGKEAINATYRDNFWDILPVERMQVSETVLAPGETVNPNFLAAEEKAIKAIQRHSMLINGREQNPQMDEAYLLLGKARYYDQRFVPAVEAFNYILHKYPLSNTINEARIWREKANIRMEFDELAIKNLKKILELENLEEDNRAAASSMLAQAYINTGSLDSAVVHIKRAAKLTDDEEEEGRFWFITGQLYDALGKKDSADYAFSEVIDLNRQTPRIYLINAHIRKIQNMDISAGEKAVVLEQLQDLARDRENRPYLDKIFFQLAEFHYGQDSVELAIDYYNRSLRSPGENPYLQSLDYETLGNIYFDASEYELAGAYYDSTLLRLPQNTREYRLISKKRENLADVIFYENLARETDSILYLASLPEEEQRRFFEEYTERLKETALVAAADETAAKVPANYFEKKRMNMPGVPNPGSSFYFYNPTTVAYGKQEFFKVWGDRELADNWRTQPRTDMAVNLDSIGRAEVVENDPRFDPETYLQRIPSEKAILDSLRQDLNFASYQLGLIYREKFNENELAAERLEFLLNNKPQERLMIPAKYNLYKIYTEMGELAKAQALKNDIIFSYPDSRYAAILQNPESLREDENNPTTLYEEVYKLYEQQQYEEAIVASEDLIVKYSGDEIVPKLELLKAMAQGRLYGLASYREGLNFVALNYPQSEEGQKAQELLKTALPGMTDSSFKNDSLGSSFKLIFPLEKTASAEAENLQQRLEEFLQERGNEKLKVSKDVYDPERIFVVVHGFSSSEAARNFSEILSESDVFSTEKNSFYISAENYRIAQIHKNLETYLVSLNQSTQ